MKKYNYFDEDYEEEYSSIPVKEDARALMHSAVSAAGGGVRRLSGRIKEFSVPRISPGFAGIAFAVVLAVIIIFVSAFSFNLRSSNKSNRNFITDAGAVCTKTISNYGSTKAEYIESEEGTFYRLTGISYARQMDFNGDDSPELLLCYLVNDEYQLEVWGYDGSEFIKFYSGAANRTADGKSWITLYRHSGKYYIGELSENDSTEMKLLTLSGKEFKESKQCRYDADGDIYSIGSKINAVDFETIRLSGITSIRAEITMDIVNSCIAAFNTKEAASIEKSKPEKQLKNEAYYEIIEKYNKKYGKASYDSNTSICFAAGLCVVDLIDFNGDGNSELLTIYRYDKKVAGEDKNGDYQLETEPEYKLEIYSWNGTAAKCIYETEGVSSMQGTGNSQRFFILQRDGEKINLCKNTYTYSSETNRVWKGTSRITGMTNENSFETQFLAVVDSDWGYLTYQLDGKRVYRSEFNQKGYRVPYFCNEDSYDNKEFSVVYLQGRAADGSAIRAVVEETEKTIKEIHPGY